MVAIVAMTLLPLGSADSGTDARLACKHLPDRPIVVRDRPGIPHARLEADVRAVEGDLQDLRTYCEGQAFLGYP